MAAVVEATIDECRKRPKRMPQRPKGVLQSRARSSARSRRGGRRKTDGATRSAAHKKREHLLHCSSTRYCTLVRYEFRQVLKGGKHAATVPLYSYLYLYPVFTGNCVIRPPHSNHTILA